MGFLERNGIVQPRAVLQRKTLDAVTRTRLSNLMLPAFGRRDLHSSDYYILSGWIDRVLKESHVDLTRDEMIRTLSEVVQSGEAMILLATIEDIAKSTENQSRQGMPFSRLNVIKFNNLFEEEGVVWRFRGSELYPIAEEIEISAIDLAIGSLTLHDESKRRLQQALTYLRPGADNDINASSAIFEAITACEAELKHLANTPSMTLGQAARQLTQTNSNKQTLFETMVKIYGWSNDVGIRHATIVNKGDWDAGDAIFVVVMVSTYLNWLAANYKPRS